MSSIFNSYSSGASNLRELQGLLTQHVMIRRLKKHVLKQLPPKQRQKIPFQVKDSDIKKVTIVKVLNL